MELTNRFRVGVPIEEAWSVLTDVERIAPCLPGAQLQEVVGNEYRGVVKVKVGPITAQYKGSATFVTKDDARHQAVLKADGRDTRGQGNASATITATLHGEPDGGTTVTVVTDLTITGKVAQFGRGVLVDVSGKLLNQFVECLESDLLTGSAQDALAAAGDDAAGPAGEAVASPEEPAWAAAPVAPEAATAVVPEPPTAETPVVRPDDAGAPSANGHASGSGGSSPSEAAPEAEEPPVARKIDHVAAEPVDLLDAAGIPVAKRAIPIVAGVLLIIWFVRRRRRRR